MSIRTHTVSLLVAMSALGLLMGCGSDPSQTRAAEGEVAPAVVPSPASTRVISAADLLSRLEEENPPVVLDVRSPEEFREGHVPGALNIPYDEIDASLDSLGQYRDREVVVYCRTGRRAEIAETRLREAGFQDVRDLDGHIQGWLASDLPVVVPAADCC